MVFSWGDKNDLAGWVTTKTISEVVQGIVDESSKQYYIQVQQWTRTSRRVPWRLEAIVCNKLFPFGQTIMSH